MEARRPRYDRWPSEAVQLVEHAVRRHGGWERWSRPYQVELRLRRFSGLIPWMKGFGTTFPAPERFEIRPHDRITTFRTYPDAGSDGVFEDGDVYLLERGGARRTAEGRDHRATFRGLAKYRRWSALDAAYFFGYALSHYHSVPFTLGDARFVRLCDTAHGPRQLKGIDVDLGSELPTHCPRQRFYFDADGLIRRHDYVASIVGSWARACHFWEDYQTRSGLAIAARRHVVARAFGRPTPVTALHAEFDDIEVRERALLR
jgi:hypothetical protein